MNAKAGVNHSNVVVSRPRQLQATGKCSVPLAQERALDTCTTCVHSTMLSVGCDDALWYRHMQCILEQEGAAVDACQVAIT